MSRNKGPEPVRTARHTEQCPWCKWWFTKRGIVRHVCNKKPRPNPGQHSEERA